MNILQHLTLRHLKMNKKRTIITIMGIALSVAMMTAVSSLVVSFQDMLYQDAVAKDGLWHVCYVNLDEETKQKIIEEPVFSRWEEAKDEELGLALRLQFKRLHKGIFDESEAICLKYGIPQESVSYHNNLLIAEGIVPGPYYTALYLFAAILLLLVAIGSVLVISNAFTISTDQRTQQFGLLKSTGATHKQVRSMVLFEAMALAAIGIPLGILAGFLATGCALAVANYLFAQIAAVNFAAKFRIVVSPLALTISIAAAVVTILLSAWLPAKKAEKTSPVEAIRQTASIKLSRRNVRVWPWTKRLFGFEGLLAAKTMKRNQGRYRTAIVSLVVSIVLFIGVSSFAQILIKATSIVYEDLDSNGALHIKNNNEELNNFIYAQMNHWPEAALTYDRRIFIQAGLPSSIKTSFYIDMYGDNPEELVLIHTMDRNSMEELAQKYGYNFLIQPDENQGSFPGLLVNTTGTVVKQGRRMNFQPFQIPAGTVLNLDLEMPIKIAGEINFIPTAIHPFFWGQYMNIIVPDTVFAKIKPVEWNDHMMITVNAKNLTAFEEKMYPYLSENLPENSFVWTNYETTRDNNKNFTYLVMTFVYGFIAMLSLIAITSVITTISTGIALRKGEMAMLRSVGMTDTAIEKMLNYENLLYGLKSLLFGIPLGFGASFAMYKAMQTVMDFEFTLPVYSGLISAAAVFLLTFATWKYAKSKVKSASIVESLRDGNL